MSQRILVTPLYLPITAAYFWPGTTKNKEIRLVYGDITIIRQQIPADVWVQAGL